MKVLTINHILLFIIHYLLCSKRHNTSRSSINNLVCVLHDIKDKLNYMYSF